MQKPLWIVGALALALLALLLIIVAGDEDAAGEEPGVLLTLSCNDLGCIAELLTLDGVSLGELQGGELLSIAREHEAQWRKQPSGQDPFVIGKLYLLAARNIPAAYRTYDNLAADLLADASDRVVFVQVFEAVWDEWHATASPHLVPTLELLHDSGRARIDTSGFDRTRRYQQSEMEVVRSSGVDPFECTSLAEQLVMVAAISDVLGHQERGLWQMHAADATMTCHVCPGEINAQYNPDFAFAFFQEAGMRKDAEMAALEMARSSLSASLMSLSDEDDLSECRVRKILSLQASGNVHDLINEAIDWFRLADFSDREVGAEIVQAVALAEVSGRPDIAQLLREHLALLITQPRKSRPGDMPTYVPNGVEDYRTYEL